MNLFDCLPCEMGAELKKLKGLRELRLRNQSPVRINVDEKWFWLGKNFRLQSDFANAPEFADIEGFVRKACNGSVFAYEKMLSQGFFTLSDGSRVGVCGTMGAEGVFRKYNSLCVRVAKYVSCVSRNFDGSVIIAGAPRSGKTTFLRDLTQKLSHNFNVAVVDERGEITCCDGFENSRCDVFLYASKKYAFEVAIRAMSPDWLVCDELSQSELPFLENALSCGVKVAATIHAENFSGLKHRLGNALNFFEYAVVLQKDSFQTEIFDISLAEQVG